MTNSQLIARLEQLSGPDREVDAEICCKFHLIGHRPAQPDDFDGRYGYSPGNIKCDTGFLQSDKYTASVDAALALAAKVLPGWRPSIGQNIHHGYWYGMVKQVDPQTGDITDFDHIGPAPAVTLLIAILKAHGASK
ncbi:MAG TPA: hypothetical protein VHP34_11410 [Alphaproteobacteria bacterium]|nr:hypothetical protein [Alphaproteobacteria bacterium]